MVLGLIEAVARRGSVQLSFHSARTHRAVRKHGVGLGRGAVLLQPSLDRVPLVGVSVRTHNGVYHHFLGDRAEERGRRRVVLLQLQLCRGRCVDRFVGWSVGEERGVEAQGLERGRMLLLSDALDCPVTSNSLLLRVRQRRSLAVAVALAAAWRRGVRPRLERRSMVVVAGWGGRIHNGLNGLNGLTGVHDASTPVRKSM